MPALAGMSKMHYPTFLVWNAAGGIAWGSVVVTAGYLAGQSYARVETWLGRGAAVVVAVVVVVALVIWQKRRHSGGADAGADAGTPRVARLRRVCRRRADAGWRRLARRGTAPLDGSSSLSHLDPNRGMTCHAPARGG